MCPRQAKVEPAPSSCGSGVESDERRVPAQGHDVRAVPQHRLRCGRQQRAEGVSQLGQRAEGGVMVELDVRHDRDVDVQREHRAVRLVGLDDEPVARAPVGVVPCGGQRAADQVRGLQAAAQQHVGDHRGGRRLAVRPGDSDRALEQAQLVQQIGARVVGQAALARGGALGVVGGDRGRVDDLDPVGGREIGRVVADVDLDAQLRQVAQPGRVGAIGARHGGPELRGDARVAAHAGSTEPDQVQPPPGPRSLVRHRRARYPHERPWRRTPVPARGTFDASGLLRNLRPHRTLVVVACSPSRPTAGAPFPRRSS